jgi:hypothetical protein
MKLPLEAFVYSMEMFVQTMRGIQRIAFQGIDMMADGDVRVPVDVSESESVVPQVKHAAPEAPYAVLEGADREYTAATQVSMHNAMQEERVMSDKDLRDDMLKLIRYKILFVKRDYEHVFDEVEELVAENTDGAGYTAWKIAQFIQDLGKHETKIPDKWGDYPDDKYEDGRLKYRQGKILTGLPEDDKKHLRIYYEVLERYPRERFKYEEEQIDILRDISRTLRDRGGPSSSTSSASTGSTGSPPSRTTGSTGSPPSTPG